MPSDCVTATYKRTASNSCRITIHDSRHTEPSLRTEELATNYNNAEFTIASATAQITLGNLNQAYAGTPSAVTATTNPASPTVLTYSYVGSGTTIHAASATPPTLAVTCSVTATLTEDYTGSRTDSPTITPAAAITADNASVPAALSPYRYREHITSG